MTTQILPGCGRPDDLPTADSITEFNAIYGGNLWSATEEAGTQLVAADGTLSRLRVWLSATPGAGGSYVFTVRKGTGVGAMADTTMTVTISAGATTGDDLVHTVAVSKGDRLSLKVVSHEPGPGWLPSSYPQWCTTFTPTTPDECLLMGGGSDVLNVATTEYNAPVSTGRTWNTGEDLGMVVIPTDGTIKDLYVWLNTDPGDAGGPDGYTFTLRQGVGDGDAMGDTTLTVTISADNTTGNDTAHDIDVAAGDVIALKCAPVNTPSATPYAFWGMIFVPDVSGEFPVMGGTYDDIRNDNVAEYLPPTTVFSPWFTTESISCSLMENCTLKKLFVYAVTDVAAASVEIEIRDDGVAALSCSVAAGDTASDVASSNLLAAGINHIGFYYISNGGTVTDLKWGFVGYNAAPSSGSTSNYITRIMNYIITH